MQEHVGIDYMAYHDVRIYWLHPSYYTLSLWQECQWNNLEFYGFNRLEANLNKLNQPILFQLHLYQMGINL